MRSHPSDKNKYVARVRHPAMRSHPSDKNKYVARVRHPENYQSPKGVFVGPN